MAHEKVTSRCAQRNIHFASSLASTLIHIAILVLSITILQLNTVGRPDVTFSELIGFAVSGSIGAILYAVDASVIWARLWDVSDALRTRWVRYRIV
ncbi:hypothetical protein M427DRAFT_282480 [Gonapodya prolifera JEL478]|uniref:MARVEL domain-containing protein n=1 Tax=Gonapodya prolifera (strain JEL478) TaxID=1344416 RepID=A0A139AZ16_GONPJ|nr:hypothetical protein M427DRAFT_282480 [Gonapodya prolifera JEL478]|eukprot:KXS21957.1 hypothetical protein M427DRAFT_282480 [Gonapodya prolifera JEL478]